LTDVSIRRLGPGDEALLAGMSFDTDEDDDEVPLAPADAAAFLADEHTFLFVALAAEQVVGFVVVNELLHRHSFARMFLIYEIGVEAEYRRRGIGRALLDAVRAVAVERRVAEGFVLTNESNIPAMALYAAAGATRPSLDIAEWDFQF
jgi:ribosomal protein S18 acetylase RimI-like enzyme